MAETGGRSASARPLPTSGSSDPWQQPPTSLNTSGLGAVFLPGDESHRVIRLGPTRHSMLEIGVLKRVHGIKADSLFIPDSCHRAPKSLGISRVTRRAFVIPDEPVPPLPESIQK